MSQVARGKSSYAKDQDRTRAWPRKDKIQPNMVPKTSSWHRGVDSAGPGSELSASARQGISSGCAEGVSSKKPSCASGVRPGFVYVSWSSITAVVCPWAPLFALWPPFRPPERDFISGLSGASSG
ncbi:hypothetical protein EYF80_007850 [Liparis tanakae]|uniref:Uncharacterized protein n=1 Tax=Liparis tanakae TaxID=230148 RepID=A0A4Z2IXC4_9TELE|nr:hypothetical protein EYF80_007850 [Liparis tanakae]